MTLAATAAAIVTAMAWRRRKTTPRTLSLVLAWAACAAMLVTAVDASFAVPRVLCEERLAGDENAAPLEERLRAALDRWTWMVRPCGRLEVTVGPRDLVTPIALGDLVELAARARVAVDVKLAEGVAFPAEDRVCTRARRGQ
ncbi:hypothetical protein OV079_52495 [Nannocystis pusilla]|uniref:Uncharacterized protein n=1 Tax=Nannocystis pusilla TaxID=889268 RepID=A0A9X3J3P7_9BACT|nr:hypothetical protein [Nannocystis pusilla]MCY1014006.1 hypothetical protein [Nannocystis pusilla]